MTCSRHWAGGTPWTEGVDGPYWTDKPDWDGYGGVLLLASYVERPDLVPGARRRRFSSPSSPDDPRSWSDSAEFEAASSADTRYPTLLGGVEGWLPIDMGPTVFQVPRFNGEPVRIGRVDHLVVELEDLARRVLGSADDGALGAVRQAGPPPRSGTVEQAGRFGLAVLLALARTAQAQRLPLVMDY